MQCKDNKAAVPTLGNRSSLRGMHGLPCERKTDKIILGKLGIAGRRERNVNMRYQDDQVGGGTKGEQ